MDTLPLFFVKLALSVLLGGCIMAGFALAGSSILWWLAMLIGLIVVFGGFLLLSGDGIGDGWA